MADRSLEAFPDPHGFDLPDAPPRKQEKPSKCGVPLGHSENLAIYCGLTQGHIGPHRPWAVAE